VIKPVAAPQARPPGGSSRARDAHAETSSTWEGSSRWHQGSAPRHDVAGVARTGCPWTMSASRHCTPQGRLARRPDQDDAGRWPPRCSGRARGEDRIARDDRGRTRSGVGGSSRRRAHRRSLVNTRSTPSLGHWITASARWQHRSTLPIGESPNRVGRAAGVDRTDLSANGLAGLARPARRRIHCPSRASGDGRRRDTMKPTCWARAVGLPDVGRYTYEGGPRGPLRRCQPRRFPPHPPSLLPLQLDGAVRPTVTMPTWPSPAARCEPWSLGLPSRTGL
jgi:hypothetical protein